jgi:hypothetical protein
LEIKEDSPPLSAFASYGVTRGYGVASRGPASAQGYGAAGRGQKAEVLLTVWINRGLAWIRKKVGSRKAKVQS